LDPRDLLRAAQTCRYWRILAEDNLLWREKCREAGLTDVLETLNIRRKKSSATGFTYSTWKVSGGSCRNRLCKLLHACSKF
jgi:F-box/WD-40 domain protein 7